MSERRTPETNTNETLASQLFRLHIAPITPIQETAMNLYALGLNVFPVPYGKKGGYPWGMMQYIRLNVEDVYPLFQGNCNIAVMTGRTSDNLFVIDCETEAVFNHQIKLMRDGGIPIWAVKSGGWRNGGHLYLRCSDGEVKNVKAGERKDMEIRGNRCYVLCPPSLHPNTRRLYQWHIRETVDPPIVSCAQVQWLGLSLVTTKTPQRLPQPFSELSSSTREFILSGATPGERNNRLFTAACDLSGCDYDFHAAVQLLTPPALHAGLTERETRDTIQSAYSKPRTPAKPFSHEKRRASSWEIAHLWAKDAAWPGRTGQTDRAVFLACCERAKTANDKGIFRASSREVAEMARVRANTATKALKRLTTAKLLVFCGRDRESGAHLYRLGATVTNEKKLRKRYTTAFSSGEDSVSLTQQIPPLFPDAAERGALGKTAYVLYTVLVRQEEPVKPGALVRASKLSKSQVSRALKKLLLFGLARKVGCCYEGIPFSQDDLDTQVARPAGTLGRGERRKKTHVFQRANLAARRFYEARFKKRLRGVSRQPARQLVCANCGQAWMFADEVPPPLVCDFCGDATTWVERS